MPPGRPGQGGADRPYDAQAGEERLVGALQEVRGGGRWEVLGGGDRVADRLPGRGRHVGRDRRAEHGRSDAAEGRHSEGDAELAGVGAAWYWVERGRAGHARRWLGEDLAATAAEQHLDGLTAARTAGDVPGVAAALEGLAGAEVLAGRGERAARLLGAAATVRNGEGGQDARVLAAARAMLGDEAFTGAFRSGCGLDPEQAVTGLRPAALRTRS